MSFWNNTTATPSIWQTLWLADKTPRYLRAGPPRSVPNFWAAPNGVVGTLVRLFGTDADRVSEFLTLYYRGADWHMDRVCSWIGAYLRDADVITIGVEDNETRQLMGVIFSTPFSTSNTVMSHGANLLNVRVIEGLAVATPFRGAGLAGYLIAQADAFTYRIYGRAVHLWSREVPVSAAFSTAIATDLYGYRRGGGARAQPQRMAWDSFTELWRRHAWRWPTLDGIEPCIVALAPINRRGGLTVYHNADTIAVVSRTDRICETGEQIYEIVWSGRFVEGVLLPPPTDLGFKPLLDAVAEALPSNTVLFGTTAPTGGGLLPTWDGWVVGRSGAHEWNLYNYVSPAYGSCRIYAIREEL